MNWRADELATNCISIFVVCSCISKTDTFNCGVDMAILKISKMHWKDIQIAAINRLSKFKKWPTSDNNPYFERVWNVIYNDKMKTKKQMKEELKKHGYK